MSETEKPKKQAFLTGEEAATAMVKVGIGVAGAIIAAHNPVTAAVAAPAFASLIAEFYGVVVPKSWRERQKRFEKAVGEKTASLPDEKATLVEERVREAENNPAVSSVLEEGFWAAGRAATQERIEHIASVVVNGVSQDEVDSLFSKRILLMLSELDDIEILVLLEKGRTISMTQFQSLSQGYFDTYVAMGDRTVKHEIADGLYENFLNHLVTLNLIEPIHSRLREELSMSGRKTKPSRYQLTNLGAIFLASIEAEHVICQGIKTNPSLSES